MRATLQKGKTMTDLATSADIAREAKQYYWYHCVDLGSGVVTDGDYDMRPLVRHYGFPKDMHGLQVLDVGRGSGFFSFEFEHRGADTTATDIASYLEWDFVGGEQRKEEVRNLIGDERAFTQREITGAFDLACRVRGSRVKSKLINVYQLRPEEFDNRRFDVVFAGSITSHLRDPILAFERLFSMTKGVCIVAAPMLECRGFEHVPLMALVGTADSDRRSWWVMSATCVVEMMRAANFRNIQVHSRFDLVNRRVAGLVVPHVVVHGHGQ